MAEIEIKLYEIELEILFSQNPFATKLEMSEFQFVQANFADKIILDQKPQKLTEKTEWALPKPYHNKNVAIIVKSKNRAATIYHYVSQMILQVFENYG